MNKDIAENRLKSIYNGEYRWLIQDAVVSITLLTPTYLFLGENGKILISVCLFVYLGVRHLIKRDIEKRPSLPAAPTVFNPFQILNDKGREIHKKTWPRDKLVDRLLERVEAAKNSHLIVSGPSGAGKSTIVCELLRDRLVDAHNMTNNDFPKTADYASITVELIRMLQSACIERKSGILADLGDRYGKFLRDHPSLAVAVAIHVDGQDRESRIRTESAERLWEETEPVLDQVLNTRKYCVFIFDQFERFIDQATKNAEEIRSSGDSKGSAAFNGFDLYFFFKFMKYLRQQSLFRTILIMRSEYLYQSFDLLRLVGQDGDRAAPGASGVLDRPRRDSQIFDYFLCPGINSNTDGNARAQIQADFEAIKNLKSKWPDFRELCRFDDYFASNTFFTQMIGYIIENFYEDEYRVRSLLADKKDRHLALRYFFDFLLNGYAKRQGAKRSNEILKAALFSVAIENRITGQAVTIDRIAELAHLPSNRIKDAVLYAKGVGLLVEEPQGDPTAYRIIHDVVGDYILGSDQFTIDPGLKDGIRGLSEARAEIPLEKRVEHLSRPVSDLMNRRTWNLPLLTMWAFYLYGAALIFDIVFFDSTFCAFANGILRTYSFSVEECEIVSRTYFPIYVTHVVWVTFAYHIDRDLFRRMLKSRIARTFSASMVVVGSILGIYLSHSIVLFAIPVCVSGTIMGILLIRGSFDGSFPDTTKTTNRRWGLFTCLNMLFTGIFLVVPAVALWKNDQVEKFWGLVAAEIAPLTRWVFVPDAADIQVALVWFIVLTLFYFWLQIRKPQQSDISIAARLAMHDRGRAEENRLTGKVV